MVSANESSKDLFLRACRGLPVERVPVWIMRQAGRYLPEYRAVRAQHSFLEVCKTPELAAEVSLQPWRRLGVDAVIVFSDILIVAEAMGQPLEIGEGAPVLGNPVRDLRGVEALKDFDPTADTSFVGAAIRQLCQTLGREVPVLGFAGAPWTLASYMVEGRAQRELATIKRMMYAEPRLLAGLLEKIAHATARYLQEQIRAGAAAVQLFDTWAGELSREDYDRFELPAIQMLIEELGAGATPVILYSKGSSHLLGSLARTGATVLSLDWRVDLAEARKTLGEGVALQGNLDPACLLGSESGVRAATQAIVERTGGRGHILNLGHGILPSTPVENARAFVEAGKSATLPTRLEQAV